MDEYLFITLAKLKADRLKLAREQRAQAELPVEAPRYSGRIERAWAAFDQKTSQVAKQSPQRELDFAHNPLEGTAMKKTVLTLAASLAINLAVLAAFERSVDQAQLPPAGEVTVTQLADPAEASLFAQAQADSELVATGSGSL